MPRIEITCEPEVSDPRIRVGKPFGDSNRSFFSKLFRAFDAQKVRYCALHVLGGELYGAVFVVHPNDKEKLAAAFSRLSEFGYFPVQWLELASGAHRIFFVRLHGAASETEAIEVMFRSRPGFTPVAKLVSRRQRENDYWVPSNEDCFEYLIADCALESACSEDGIKHLQFLIARLGRASSEKQLQHLFGSGQGTLVVSALLSNQRPGLALDSLRRLRRRILLRHPWKCLQSWITRWAGRCRSAVKPRGAFLVFLGPDGVGKTTLLRELSEALARLFPIRSVYRWRPGVFARAPRPACMPHSKPLRTVRGSMFYLLFAWMDFLAGYLSETRWILAQSGLVIFDRYYHDILVDPVRYRYAGPKWLLQILARLIPPRDVFFFILDADEERILSRKQQLPTEEISRQRTAYRNFANRAHASAIIETNRPVAECKREALRQCFAYLSRQLAKRHGLAIADSAVVQNQLLVSRRIVESTTTAEKRHNAEENSSLASTGINTEKSSVQHISVPSEVSVPSERVHVASDLN